MKLNGHEGAFRAAPSRATRVAAFLLVGLLTLLLLFVLLRVVTAYAQTTPRAYSSYVTPFPDKGVYKILVLGDSLGEGTWAGLAHAFKRDATVEVINRAKYGTGFSRRIHIGRDREFLPLLDEIKPDIIVITNGATDATASIYEGRKRQRFGSPRWNELYNERLDHFMKRLRAKNIAVYWVGLPIMRDAQINENMNTLNELYREKAHINNFKFIDTWNGFIDQYGNYSPYGPDIDGRVARLRSNDGIRFTQAGYEKLANYVEREIRRDLIAARSERNVPLAGDTEEQKEINHKGAAGSSLAGLARGDAGGATRKALARSTSSGSAFGEIIASDRASGLTLLSSVTRANDPALSGGRHNLPLSLRPYYRVLVKGETLSPKPGRSDDFTWRQSNPNASSAVTR